MVVPFRHSLRFPTLRLPVTASGSGRLRSQARGLGDWSRARPVGKTARRNVGNGKERLRDDSVSRSEIPPSSLIAKRSKKRSQGAKRDLTVWIGVTN